MQPTVRGKAFNANRERFGGSKLQLRYNSSLMDVALSHLPSSKLSSTGADLVPNGEGDQTRFLCGKNVEALQSYSLKRAFRKCCSLT